MYSLWPTKSDGRVLNLTINSFHNYMCVAIKMAIWRTAKCLNLLVKDKERQIQYVLKTKYIIHFQIQRIADNLEIRKIICKSIFILLPKKHYIVCFTFCIIYTSIKKLSEFRSSFAILTFISHSRHSHDYSRQGKNLFLLYR